MPGNISSLTLADLGASLGNPPWAEASSRFLVVRLSPFRDVERSTPHQFLYRELRAAMPHACIDFDFFPSARQADKAGFGAGGQRQALATGASLALFDVALVSNSYTLELVNLAPWLMASGIPVTRTVREEAMAKTDVRYPLIILGGSNALASSSIHDPASGDSMVDAIFFGEGEGAVARMAGPLATAARFRGQQRLDALLAIAREVRGFWPSASLIPVFQAKAGADEYPTGAPPQLPGEEAGTVRLEISRGCPNFCTFCFEGWERKPYRERPLESILAEAASLKAATGADAVELASYNFNAHSRIVDVIKGLNRIFNTVGFQSQRVDILARSPGLIRFEAAAGKRSFTVGVEGLSGRMRAYYNKELNETDIRTVLASMVREGAREIKLFYILNGYENDADIAEFSAFMGWLEGMLSAQPPGSRPRIILSVGELLRMPFTPLAYEALILEPAPYAAISARLREIAVRCNVEFRSPEHFDEYCLSQVLALLPSGCLELLAALAERGYAYDRNLSRGAWEFARGWLDARGLLDQAFLGRKDRKYPFPYQFITPLASRDLVYQRWLDAASFTGQRSCLGSSCVGCSACDDSERGFLEEHSFDGVSQGDPKGVLRGMESLMAAKRKPYRYHIQAKLTEEAAPHDPAYAAALFRRQLYKNIPQLCDSVWTATDAFLKSGDGLERLPGAWGDTVYTVLSSSPIDGRLVEAAGYKGSVELDLPERFKVDLFFKGASMAMALKLLTDFLNAAAIPHTLRKNGDRAAMEISGKGLKKNNVLQAAIFNEISDEASQQKADTVHGTLECGKKYDLSLLGTLAGKMKMQVGMQISLKT